MRQQAPGGQGSDFWDFSFFSCQLTEAKGEATALMKTFFFNRDKRGGKGGGSHDMLGGAGQNALGAVATGLMVNNPQEMSRVTRLLVDMVPYFSFSSWFDCE